MGRAGAAGSVRRTEPRVGWAECKTMAKCTNLGSGGSLLEHVCKSTHRVVHDGGLGLGGEGEARRGTLKVVARSGLLHRVGRRSGLGCCSCLLLPKLLELYCMNMNKRSMISEYDEENDSDAATIGDGISIGNRECAFARIVNPWPTHPLCSCLLHCRLLVLHAKELNKDRRSLGATELL